MTQQEAINIVQRYVDRKVENEGIDEWGLLSAEDFNALARLVISLLSLGGHTNVNDSNSNNDVVLFKSANSQTWTVKSLSEIKQNVDVYPQANSNNPVSSKGVYIRLSELAEQLNEALGNVAYIDDDDEEQAQLNEMSNYPTKQWVIQNFIGKSGLDTTPTENSNNPVTSAGIKRYVDQHAGEGGGGGSTITTFSVTTSTNNGITTYNWGTTKYSDVKNAIEHSDEVLLNIDNGLCIMRHTETMSDAGATSYCFFGAVAIINVAYAFASIGEGSNDSIVFNWDTFVPNSKQDVISDLNAIRTNAGLGSEAWNALANKQDILLEVWNIQMVTDTTDPENPVYTYSIPNHTYTELMTAIENKKDILCVLMSNDVPLQYFRLNTFLGAPFFYSLTYFGLSSSPYSIAVFEVTNNNGSIVLADRSLTLGGGGDTNVIETVKVNGTALIPDANKAVDVPVPKVAVFTSTSTESDGTYTFDFGTTKFSDIQNAIQNNDFVFLINNGVKYVYSMNLFGVLEFYTVVALGNVGVMFLGLQQGENDSITGVVNTAEILNADWNESDTSSLAFIKNKPTIPSALSQLSTDATHQTVTNAEKTKWNAATKGLEKIAEADIDNAITAGIYEVNESAAPGVPYLLMVEMRSSTETIEDPISGEVISSIMHLYYFQTRLRNNVISRRQRVDVGSWSAWEDVTDNTKADKVTSATANNAAALDANGNLKDSGVPAAGIPFGRVDSTSTATAFTATVPGITELRDGMCVLLENGVVTSAAGFTLNINNLGAKPSFNNMTAATRDTTIFNVNYTMLFVYDAMRVVDGITGAWCCYRGYDGNTNTIGYQVRTNSSTLPVSDQTGRYRLLFTSADGSKYVPATTSTSTNATSSRAVNQRPIDPHGAIVYYSSTTVISANGNVGTSSQWQQYTLTLGYSFNRTGAALVLSYPKPVYVKCAPQTDGSAIIDADTPYVQALPTTADGKIYIHLGRAYSATAIELTLDHPVYHYYNGAIRRWLGPV